MKQLYALIFTPDTAVSFLPSPLYTVSVGELTAVVRDVPAIDYQQLPQDELLQELIAQQQTLELLLPTYQLLPFQFGSLLVSDEQVAHCLATHHDKLLAAWQGLTGLVQMEVGVKWGYTAVLNHIADALNLPQIQQEMQTQPAEQQRQTELEVQRMLSISLAQRQNELESLLREAVGELAQKINKLPQTDDNTAVNLALLLPATDQAELTTVLAELSEQLPEQCHIHQHGPLPPYSFVRVQVQQPNAEQVVHAQQLLGIGTSTSLAELKEAYQNHPYYSRPNENSDLGSIIKMTELAQCYKLLRDIAQNQPDGSVCRLDNTAVAQTILLTIHK
jgi:hypothetical protein